MSARYHPSVRHIRAYISTLGASVALGDLDGDGLQNDVVWVDPRTDQVICGPVPGTGERFETFALDPGPSFPNWNPATMCPQGILIADLNEDGLLDVLVVHWGRSPIVYLQRTPADSEDPAPGGPIRKPQESRSRALTAGTRQRRPRPTWTVTDTLI